MRRYIITLLVVAFLVGSLFKAASDTGIRLMNMFATIGIFLFGIVGSMAISRWQSRQGLHAVETVLKSLEPDWIITDWAFQRKEGPDYLLVGPAGIVAICLNETPQTTRAKKATSVMGKARERVLGAAQWLRGRLTESSPRLKAPLAELAKVVPVQTLVVLVRRRSQPDYSADGVTVLNAEQLGEHIRSFAEPALLDEVARVKMTQVLRQA